MSYLDDEELGSCLVSLEAEKSALGAMILSATSANECKAILKPEHFYRESHRLIFEAMRSTETPDLGFDLVLIFDLLGSRLTDAGGKDYVMHLAEYCPSPGNAKHYAGLVIEAWQRRSVIDGARQAAIMARNPDEPIDNTLAVFSSLGTIGAANSNPFVNLRDVDIDNTEVGRTTHIPALDNLFTTKGWAIGQMHVIAASSKGGKTSFMVRDFLKSAMDGERVLYALFADFSPRDLKRRCIKQLCGFENRPYGVEEQEEYDRARREFDYLECEIYDAGRNGRDIETFEAWVKARQAKTPYSRIYMDYAQKIKTRSKEGSNMVARQTIVSDQVQFLAREIDTPILIGSQITAGTGGAADKTKWGTAYEDDCGSLLVLGPKSDDGYIAPAELKLNRFGPSGSFNLGWDKRHVSHKPE